MIGIGAGHPDHLTLQAAKAIGRTDVFFLLDKGEAKQSMIELRQRVMKAYGRPGPRVRRRASWSSRSGIVALIPRARSAARVLGWE